MMEGEVAHLEYGPLAGDRLVVLQRNDGFFHYRVEWIETDDGDGNGPYRNYRDFTSLFGTVDDALREACSHLQWL